MHNEPDKISIKVNGKDRPVMEIKEEQEVAAAIDRESIETPFEWVLPKDKPSDTTYFFNQNRSEKQMEDYQPISYDRKPGLPIHRKKQRMPFKGQLPSPKMPFQFPKRLLIPIGSAVLIGCMIGLIVLMIFTGDEFKSKTEPQSTGIVQESPAGTEEGTTGTAVEATKIDVSIITNIIQGGVYSSSESAQEVVEQAKDNGFAAVFDPADNRVILGVGSNEDLSALLPDYQTIVSDAYSKEWTISGKEIAVNDENQLQWVESGKVLFEKVLAADAGVINGMQSDLLEWKNESLGSVSVLSKEQQEKSIAFINALSTISENKDDKWDLQQAKLNAVIHYKSLINSF
ncbi:hypothetical protein [Alkalihalobacillus sp. TS-13]|uniref:hypothetical protein n=1 Tax=Alkalihalobacillus sp. TS-13 TaxID=2842455 RepID=UPI001C875FFA|nr:hypothetical protein [Alkalihalobacillus sp. TS-13]